MAFVSLGGPPTTPRVGRSAFEAAASWRPDAALQQHTARPGEASGPRRRLNPRLAQKLVAGCVTLAEPALDEHGQAVNPADNNHVEAESVSQTS